MENWAIRIFIMFTVSTQLQRHLHRLTLIGLEILINGISTFLGPLIAPGHVLAFWLWMSLWQIEAIEMHSGVGLAPLSTALMVLQTLAFQYEYDFPWSPTKYIPFYGGSEHHDFHHFVGGQSQNNFASVFSYCDYIYCTDMGFRYRRRVRGKEASVRLCWWYLRQGVSQKS